MIVFALALWLAIAPVTPIPSGAHDFDFNIGNWSCTLRQRLHPLSGSDKWATFHGTMTVNKILGGLGNVVEIAARGASGPLHILAIRLYDEKTREWSLSFSSPGNGSLTSPMIGHFENGRGTFYDQETVAGRTVLGRFTFFAGNGSYHDQQAYSADGGKTWEVDFAGRFTKQ